MYKLARSARSHIHNFLNVSALSVYCRLYSHYTIRLKLVIKGNCIDCICMQMLFET